MRNVFPPRIIQNKEKLEDRETTLDHRTGKELVNFHTVTSWDMLVRRFPGTVGLSGG